MEQHNRRAASQRRYPPELRERAVRMVAETIAEQGERHGAVTKVGRQLGIGTESLRTWVAQAEVNAGQRPGLSSEERERLKILERENRELRRANEILKSASLTSRSSPPSSPSHRPHSPSSCSHFSSAVASAVS